MSELSAEAFFTRHGAPEGAPEGGGGAPPKQLQVATGGGGGGLVAFERPPAARIEAGAHHEAECIVPSRSNSPVAHNSGSAPGSHHSHVSSNDEPLQHGGGAAGGGGGGSVSSMHGSTSLLPMDLAGAPRAAHQVGSAEDVTDDATATPPSAYDEGRDPPLLAQATIPPADGAGEQNESVATASPTNLFVRHIPVWVSDDDLRLAFEKFGTVVSASVMRYISTGDSKGHGFVMMSDAVEAQRAIDGVVEFPMVPEQSSVAAAGDEEGVAANHHECHHRIPALVMHAKHNGANAVIADRRRVFVSNVPSHLMTQDVLQYFDRNFGTVLDCVVQPSKPQGPLSMSIAFVEFEQSEQAQRAIKQTHGTRPFGDAFPPVLMKVSETKLMRHQRHERKDQQHVFEDSRGRSGGWRRGAQTVDMTGRGRGHGRAASVMADSRHAAPPQTLPQRQQQHHHQQHHQQQQPPLFVAPARADGQSAQCGALQPPLHYSQQQHPQAGVPQFVSFPGGYVQAVVPAPSNSSVGGQGQMLCVLPQHVVHPQQGPTVAPGQHAYPQHIATIPEAPNMTPPPPSPPPAHQHQHQHQHQLHQHQHIPPQFHPNISGSSSNTGGIYLVSAPVSGSMPGTSQQQAFFLHQQHHHQQFQQHHQHQHQHQQHHQQLWQLSQPPPQWHQQ